MTYAARQDVQRMWTEEELLQLIDKAVKETAREIIIDLFQKHLLSQELKKGR